MSQIESAKSTLTRNDELVCDRISGKGHFNLYCGSFIDVGAFA